MNASSKTIVSVYAGIELTFKQFIWQSVSTKIQQFYIPRCCTNCLLKCQHLVLLYLLMLCFCSDSTNNYNPICSRKNTVYLKLRFLLLQINCICSKLLMQSYCIFKYGFLAEYFFCINMTLQTAYEYTGLCFWENTRK
jgi:hypothetical protein